MSATHADWAAAAGRTVRATAADGTEVDLQLVEVSAARDGSGWTAYTLRFEGGPDLSPEQQTYELATDGISEPVFLVPTGRTGEGLSLEAVFAQPAPTAPTAQKEN